MFLWCSQAHADTWAGRSLLEVLIELRASGIPLIYSSQVVTADLRIAAEPVATQPADRLREALQPFGLTLRPLDAPSAGFAIVRATPNTEPQSVRRQQSGSVDLEEITVFASRYQVARENDPDALNVPHAVLERTTGAEQDALRALQYFPGTASNNISSFAHVRGGADSETLVRFDGVELYNPVHLKDFQGLFGLIDPEVVQSLAFFSGGYPARFGNHLSGVVDIEPRRSDTADHLIGASMLYSRAISSGSFDDRQGSWLFGYRKSMLGQVLRELKREIGEPELEDFLARVSYDWRGAKITAGALRLNDDLQLFTADRAERAFALYHDTYAWLRVEHAWNDWLTGSWQYSRAKLEGIREGSLDVDLIGSGALQERHHTSSDTLALTWTATVNSNTALEWGARAERGETDYRYADQTTFLLPLAQSFSQPLTGQRQFDGAYSGNVYAAYLSARSGYDRWSGELGLRWDDHTYIDRAARLSPRLSLRYALAPHSSLRFSVGRYVQAQNLSDPDLIENRPSFSEPESSRQLIAGLDRQFTSFNLRVEAYHKRNRHVRPHYENILDTLTLAPELEIDRVLVAPQSSAARGIEFLLNSTQQAPLNWWLTYTWSQVHDRIDGKDILRSWDQTHALTAGFAWSQIRWRYSASFTWRSGWPYTPVHIDSGNGIAVLGERNSARFQDFSSLELRVQYTLPLGRHSLEAFLELRNAFNRANECCREISVTDAGNGQRFIAIENKNGLSMVPLAGINWRF